MPLARLRIWTICVGLCYTEKTEIAFFPNTEKHRKCTFSVNSVSHVQVEWKALLWPLRT
jgi:hypothetical protein